jgi:hypothetical protein
MMSLLHCLTSNDERGQRWQLTFAQTYNNQIEKRSGGGGLSEVGRQWKHNKRGEAADIKVIRRQTTQG